MAPNFDSVLSSLLCAEDNDCVFDDNDCHGTVSLSEDFESSWHHSNRRQDKGFSYENSFMMLPMQSDVCLSLMVEKECEHLPCSDYLMRLKVGDLDLGARKEAIEWIAKVHSHFGFGPLCAYLSMNYLDRFLSAYELPKGKAWMMQLLAVACLSLAAKMEEPEVPLSLDLQVGDTKFVFEARTIQRMELLVLSTLGWRMQAITPFSYLDNFLNKINDNETPPRSLILKSVQLILSTIKGLDFLEFRPSEIAAAVAIAAVGETKTVDTDQAISSLKHHFDKEKVVKCLQLFQDLPLDTYCFGKGASGTHLAVPRSPIGVLDAACLSYRSDDTTVGSSSCANSSQNTPPDAKRRKLNTPCQV